MFNRIIVLIFIGCFGMSCSQPCTDVCEFEGSKRSEEIDLYGLDTTWYDAPEGSILMYDGSDGSQLEYTVISSEIEKKTVDSQIPCGDCGDSILLCRTSVEMNYIFQDAVNDETWTVNLNGERFYPDTSLLYKCVRGEVKYSGPAGNVNSTFLAGCNIIIDSTRINRLSDLYHDFKYSTAFDTNICMTDSSNLFLDSIPGNLKYIELSHKAPIQRFQRDNVCYEYMGFR